MSARPPVVQAGVRDAPRLASILAEAFADDPVARWTFGDPGLLDTVFRRLAREIYLPRGWGHLIGDEGAALWLRPGSDKSLPAWPLAALAATVAVRRGPGAVSRALAVDAAMASHRPVEPHSYLFAIGLRAAARGRGLGRVLAQATLDDCDRNGVAAYLENSNPANEAFYRGLGFTPTSAFEPASGAPLLVGMWRPPRAR